jgi:tetratricopeptide (TPR) repeat protein
MEYADGKYEMALVDFNLAIESDPNFGEAYNSRGLVYDTQGNYGKAIADFDKAIELLPNWAGSYNNRGTVYFEQGDYDQAIADFGKAIQLDAQFGKAYFNRGLAYQVLGNYKAAIADFDKTIELTPESELAAEMSTVSGTAESGFSYASTYHHAFSDLSSTDQAGGSSSMIAGMTNYLQFTQSSADLSLAYANRGLAYYHLGDFEYAGADLEKALSLGLDPTDQAWVETLLGNLH